jgi:drug/metabolite transporter (DMT)-like permease
MATVIAILAALAAAMCFAVGSFLQQGAARTSTVGALRIRLLLDLLRRRRWLAGVTLSFLSFAIQGLALAFGPLALVQPIAATEVLFALPLIARTYRRRLTGQDVLGALMVTGGVAVFLVVSPPTNGVGVPGLTAWLPVLTGAAVLVVGSGFAALRVSGRPRVVWLAAAAGIMYGLLDALAKSTVDLMKANGTGALAAWEPYAMIAAGVVGALFGQSAFESGALALSLPVLDTLEPVAAVVIAATVFGERLASSPVLQGFQLAGGALAAAGIAVLSRSSIVAAETSGPPGAAGTMPAGRAAPVPPAERAGQPLPASCGRITDTGGT